MQKEKTHKHTNKEKRKEVVRKNLNSRRRASLHLFVKVVAAIDYVNSLDRIRGLDSLMTQKDNVMCECVNVLIREREVASCLGVQILLLAGYYVTSNYDIRRFNPVVQPFHLLKKKETDVNSA